MNQAMRWPIGTMIRVAHTQQVYRICPEQTAETIIVGNTLYNVELVETASINFTYPKPPKKRLPIYAVKRFNPMSLASRERGYKQTPRKPNHRGSRR